jgi:hypothetical protein
VTALALSHPKLRELIIQVDMGASRIAAGAACDLDERPSGDIEIGHELVMSHLAAFQQLKHVLGPDFPHSWLSFEPWIKNTSNSASIETSMKELVGTLNRYGQGLVLWCSQTPNSTRMQREWHHPECCKNPTHSDHPVRDVTFPTG